MGNACSGVTAVADREFDRLLAAASATQTADPDTSVVTDTGTDDPNESVDHRNGMQRNASDIALPAVLGGQGREYLVIAEVLQIEVPQQYGCDLKHLGSLYVLDRNKDGRFYKTDLHEYISLCDRIMKKYRMLDLTVLGAKVRAYCTLQLWNVLCNEGGEATIVDWILRMFCENLPILKFENYSGMEFINRFSVQTMHEILSSTSGEHFQSFLDLLQRVAEEKGILKLDDSELDDVLPVSILKEFTAEFVQGFVLMMKELGFEGNYNLEVV